MTDKLDAKAVREIAEGFLDEAGDVDGGDHFSVLASFALDALAVVEAAVARELELLQKRDEDIDLGCKDDLLNWRIATELADNRFLKALTAFREKYP